jgi:hypothetical protein
MLCNPPRQSSIIKPILTVKLDHQALLQVVRRLSHDLGITVLEDMVSSDLDLTISRLCTKGGLTSEIDELSSEIALILRDILIQGRRKSWVVPRCGLVIVNSVHTEYQKPLTLVSIKCRQINIPGPKSGTHCDPQSTLSLSRLASSPTQTEADQAERQAEAAPSNYFHSAQGHG